VDAVLDVPDARIYYKTRGAGPVLLLLPGGDGDADACDTLAGHLEPHFTVLTYDRRGLSRSTFTGKPPDLAAHADDAALVLAAATDIPALVFGTSIGALIALELTVRHPDRVRMAVTHEPPISALLPDVGREELVNAQQDVEDLHRRAGVPAAMARFIQLAGLDFTDREPDIPLTPPSPARLPNLEYFLTYDAPAVRQYQPDKAAMRAAGGRIVPAAGTSSTGPVPLCAYALADLLKTDVATFPGGHNGPILRPRAFAERLGALVLLVSAGQAAC
jgi:pimeloyl-ACP methyl ester carboxylesterase